MLFVRCLWIALLAAPMGAVSAAERLLNAVQSEQGRWELIEFPQPSPNGAVLAALALRHIGGEGRASAPMPLTLSPASAELHAGLTVEHSANDAVVLSFAMKAKDGGIQHIAAWLVRPQWDAAFTLAGDFAVLGDGAKKPQTLTLTENQSLTRRAHRTAIESFTFTQDCGCCKAIQTRTVETIEEEALTWNSRARTAESLRFQKWYVVQPGEGLMAVCRKAFGDASLMGRLYRLNPELQGKSFVAEGQKILIERRGGR